MMEDVSNGISEYLFVQICESEVDKIMLPEKDCMRFRLMFSKLTYTCFYD